MATMKMLEHRVNRAMKTVQARLPYIDSVKVYFDREIEDAELVALADLAGSILRLEAMPHQPWWRSGLFVHQPSAELLDYVSAAFDNTILCRADFALDLAAADLYGAELLTEFIRDHLVQHRRGKNRQTRYRTTTYFGRASSRNNIAVYGDKPSKVDGSPCAHVEWRISGRTALKAAGITCVGELLNFDHRSFWTQRLNLRTFPGYHELQRLGCALHGQPKRRRPWVIPMRGGRSLDHFVRIGNSHVRAIMTENSTVQEMIDCLGPDKAKYFPRLAAEWMLPDPMINCGQPL